MHLKFSGVSVIPNWTVGSTKVERLVPSVVHTQKEMKV